MMSCVVLMGQRRFRARYIDACFTRFVDRSHRDYPERDVRVSIQSNWATITNEIFSRFLLVVDGGSKEN